MALRTRLEAATEGGDTDESTSADQPEASAVLDDESSPFSMSYDTGDWNLDSDDLNNVLTALVAATNLL